ncbi:MAG: chromate transporter [Atribacterota bacterium]
MLFLFGKFLLIGAFTWGGGYAMLPLIKRELVRPGLLSLDEFLEILALAQSLPGAVAINTASLAGRKLAGPRGQFISILGSVLPSFFSIVILAFFLFRAANLTPVRHFFHGAIPMVAALILFAVWDIGKTVVKNAEDLIVALLFVVLLRFFHFHPLWVVLLGGVYGMVRKK